MNPLSRTVIIVCVFSVAMAALESAVVVYLRTLYYPDGFTVAFRLVDQSILAVELLRELATLVMLLSVGYLAGKNFTERLAYFVLSFAVWDISYYAWLKVLIDWPASLLEWDILFLIPITWLGPVLAPIVSSLCMILLAFALLRYPLPLSRISWSMLLAGSALILYTFMVDYGSLIVKGGFLKDYPALLDNSEFVERAIDYYPLPYSWGLFGVGTGIQLLAIYFHCRQSTLKRRFSSATPLTNAARP